MSYPRSWLISKERRKSVDSIGERTILFAANSTNTYPVHVELAVYTKPPNWLTAGMQNWPKSVFEEGPIAKGVPSKMCLQVPIEFNSVRGYGSLTGASWSTGGGTRLGNSFTLDFQTPDNHYFQFVGGVTVIASTDLIEKLNREMDYPEGGATPTPEMQNAIPTLEAMIRSIGLENPSLKPKGKPADSQVAFVPTTRIETDEVAALLARCPDICINAEDDRRASDLISEVRSYSNSGLEGGCEKFLLHFRTDPHAFLVKQLIVMALCSHL